MATANTQDLTPAQVATLHPKFWAEWVTKTIENMEEHQEDNEDVDLDKIKSLSGDPDAFIKELDEQGYIELFSSGGDWILNYSTLSGGPSAECVLAYNTKTGEWDYEPYDNPDLEDVL